MSKVVFEDNNGHRIEIKRVQYTLSDSLNCEDSGIVKGSMNVEVTGWMRRTEIKNYQAWSYDGKKDTTIKRNTIGDINFYDTSGGHYLTVENVFIMSIEETSETWREWGQVKATFSNEGMLTDASNVVLFRDSITIYNAQVTVVPSILKKNIYTVPIWNGSFTQEMGYDNTKVTLTGIIPYDSCEFPEEIVALFEPYIEENGVYIPMEGDLSDFITNKTVSNLNIGSVFIENATLSWNMSRKIISVSVMFSGPHQDLKKGGV
jgi:hypothetical protein